MATEKTIELPCFDIVIKLHDGGGTITSSLIADQSPSEDDRLHVPFNAIESMILGHACAGVAIDSPAYIEGIKTAVDAVLNAADVEES